MATFLTPRATCLRTLTAPRHSAPSTVCAAFTTSAAKPLKQHTRLQRTSLISQLPRAVFVRSASTSGIPPPSSSQQNVPDHILTWNRFFDLRRKRRWINLGCSVATAFTTAVVLGPVLAEQDLETWAAQISGMDPLILLGVSTLAIAAGGWLLGPTVGNVGFGLWASRRGWKAGIAEVSHGDIRRMRSRWNTDAD